LTDRHPRSRRDGRRFATAARRSLLALASAVALAGCVSTRDEPFPLDGGDAAAVRLGDYLCATHNRNGHASANAGRLVQLRANGKTQYVFLDSESASVEPFTLHRVEDGVYFVAVAHSDAAGEDVLLVRLAAGGATFRVFAMDEAASPRAQALARRRAVALSHSWFGDDLSGPVDAQRSFLLELAADPAGWRMTAECRAGARPKAR